MNRIVSAFLNRLAFVCPGGSSARPWLQRWRGARIGRHVFIGAYVYFDELHPESLSIGDNCTIGMRTSIFTHVYFGPPQPNSNGKVVIENNVFIGPHCVILPNVRIGEGAVIKAGTVVSRSVPARTFWGPPPADSLGRATVSLTAEHGYAEFLRGLEATSRTPATPNAAR